MSSGQARLPYSKYNAMNKDRHKFTAVIPAVDFGNFQNLEGYCTDDKHYNYLFLSDGEIIIPYERV